MKTLAACLQRAVDAGQISEALARKIDDRVVELLGKGFAEAPAMAKAAQEVADAAKRLQRQTSLRVLRTAEAEALAASHPNGFAAGVLSLLARDLWQKATWSNVEARARAIRGLAHAELADVLDRFRSKMLGLMRDEAGMVEFVRALYGAKPKDPAIGQLADAWARATDRLVDRFNAAGGSLPRKADWRLPQLWDRDRVVAAGRREFLDWMEDQHAQGRLTVIDPDTGKEVDPLRRAEIFSQAYDRIRTDGLIDLTPGAQRGVGILANSRSQLRAFQWTTAEAWLEANDRFGAGNGALYDLLNGHIDGMAHDIAQLEILGPNPEWTVRYLRDAAMKRLADDPERAKKAAFRIDTVWAHVSGTANTPVSEWLATAFRETRAFLAAAKLGSALLSSGSDFATMRQVAAWNGLPSVGWMREYLKLLNPANADHRKLAVQTGLLAEAWAQRAVGAMRNQADVIGTGLGSRIADFVLRAQGLTAHTQASRWAIGMEFLTRLADDAAKRFGELDPLLRQGMQRYGVGPAEWDLVRQAGVITQGGVTVLSPDAIARQADLTTPDGRALLDAATRVLEFVQTEARFAIPEPSVAERSLVLQQLRPGTFVGELWRSALQFKSFPITILLMHGGRGMAQAGIKGKAAYLASFGITATLMGALQMQLKEIAAGRDPRRMDDHRFWGAAFAQGGGAGVLGDFLYSAVARTDQDFWMQATGGPFGSLVSDVMKIAGLNIQALDDERRERAIGADIVRFVRNNTPGSTLWYSRLAMDRLLWDELQWYADPNAARQFRQLERRRLREYEQEFWWAPGDAAPRRAPAGLATIGGRP